MSARVCVSSMSWYRPVCLLRQLLLLAGVCGRSALMECLPEMPTPTGTHVCVSVFMCVRVCEL